MAYQLKLPKHWLIHNAFHVSLLKPYKGEPPKEAITEDPPKVEGKEEVLQPESVLRHEDKVLRSGKIIRRYLIKFKNYPFDDAKWMQGTQLKDSLHFVNAYNDSLEIMFVEMMSPKHQVELVTLLWKNDMDERADMLAADGVSEAPCELVTTLEICCRILIILDPCLGDVWKEKVFSLRFEGKDCINTLGKLKSLALIEKQIEKRVNLLSLLDASKRMREMYFVPSGDIDYRGWLSKKFFLEKIECAAIVTLGDLSSLCDLTSPMLLLHDYPLQAYMEEIKLEARNHMFVSMRTRDSKSEYKGTRIAKSSQSKATELDQAAQRVVYRYLFALVKEGKLKELPVQCLPWCDLEGVSCMYPPNMRDLSSWELANDPWWIDLKPGVILARERELFKLHGHGKQVISLGKEKKDKITKTVETHDVELDIETEVANTVNNAHQTRELEKNGIILFKELCVFSYSMVSPGDLAYCGDAPFYGCDVGNYIAMGQDFLRSHVLFFVHHLDTHTKKFYDASKAIFKKLHILQNSDWWTHFLLDAKKTVLSRMVAIQRPMERSPTFMEVVLDLLCLEDGLVSEKGCGTLPIMKACQAIGRACFSFDNDVGIVSLATRPLVQAITCNRRVHLQGEVEHEDDEVNPVSNPYN
ncbi:hypothetical protein L7F22_069191 [Adiantum nelumboides]|nr:hypothetical protein [Adiantum nelumboides]